MKTAAFQNFSGGISVGEKTGADYSAKFIKNLDIFESPDYITNSKALSKVSGTTVDNLILWMADGSPWDTNRYFYDNDYVIYQEDSGGTWSKLRTVTSTFSTGTGFLVHDNYLYYTTPADIGRYGPLGSSPAFDDSFYSWWLQSDLEQTGGGTGATAYSVAAAIAETATHRQTFAADHDGIWKVTIDIANKGTGNWTCTVHDSNNRSIAAVTVANAGVSTGDFTFSVVSSTFVAARVVPGEQYHFHITTSDGTGTVNTEVNNDLEGAEFTILYTVLLTYSDYGSGAKPIGFHPMEEMLGGWAIGNGNYIGYFDSVNGEYNPTKIFLAPGFQVRSLYRVREYLVAEAWSGQTFAQSERARRYYWDGIEVTFNFFEDLPMGGTNAAAAYRNNVVGIYGNRGGIYTGSEPFEKMVDRIPTLAKGKTIEVYPGAITEHEEKLLMGYSAVTDDANFEQGIYQFGSQTDQFANVLSFPYTISTSTTQGTTVKIGAVKAFGEDLYVSWRDGANYGVDKLSIDSSAVNGGTWESRIFDDGDAGKKKQAIKLEITYETLTTGQTVTPKYKINRAGSWTSGTAGASGSTTIDLFINKIFNEIEVGFDLGSTSNTFIKVTKVEFVYEPLTEEDDDA